MGDGRWERGKRKVFQLSVNCSKLSGEGCGNEESLPYMFLSAPHRDAATAGAGCEVSRALGA